MSDPPILYMDHPIRPHRSLSARGMAAILGVLIAYNLILSVLMVMIGAFPVPVFLGLDVLGVLIAFKVSQARAKRGERVQVSHDAVTVLHEAGARRRTLWTSPTAFTRVEIDRRDDRVERVRVRLARRSLAVGAALGPGELADFAVALQSAIKSALAERHA
jgi:uncharacterized membrane protein